MSVTIKCPEPVKKLTLGNSLSWFIQSNSPHYSIELVFSINIFQQKHRITTGSGIICKYKNKV